MKLNYKNKKLEKQLTDPRELQKTFGVMAKQVNQRIKELKSADTLEVMRTIPASNCHELKGQEKGSLAVDISRNWRIVFEPDEDPIPRKEDGGLNWSGITIIKIINYIDYH